MIAAFWVICLLASAVVAHKGASRVVRMFNTKPIIIGPTATRVMGVEP